jgi:hypothetical protein
MFNKRQVARRAFDPEHRRLMLAYARARGGDRLRRLRELQQWMVAQLKEAASA